MTAQVPDRISLDGGPWRALHSVPSVFGPTALRTVRFRPRPTANYRGYGARWQIADGQLWLVGLGGIVDAPGWRETGGSDNCTLADIYGPPDPVFAGWIGGELLLPEPERIWDATYGRYLRLRVEAGRVRGAVETVEIEPQGTAGSLERVRRRGA